MKESVIRPVRVAEGAWVSKLTPALSLHFEGLANPTRLLIVEQLARAAEMRVTELANLLVVSQPRMSWHLRILRRAQVVRTRRDGREVFCRLDREAIAMHLRTFGRLINTGGTDGEPVPSTSEGLS